MRLPRTAVRASCCRHRLQNLLELLNVYVTDPDTAPLVALSQQRRQYGDTMRTPPPVLPPQDETPEYKRTWMDRVGGDAGYQMRAYGYGLQVFGITTGAVFLIMAQGGGRVSAFSIVITLLISAAVGSLVTFMALKFASGSGAVMKAFTLPSGNSTPYEEQFSYQESMIARGDVDGALESFEAIIAECPDSVNVRLKAAEHYAARRRNPKRAAELFVEARKIAGVTSRDAIYATSRLIDLYDGPLDEPGRALVEMRRVIEQYPDSAVAKHARAALPSLKARINEG